MSIARYFNPRLRARLVAGDLPGWLQRHPRQRYIVAAIISAPPWCDHKAIHELRNLARRRTAETGLQHVLDHIIPLNHPSVCGLSVSWNLQVVTYAQNAYKSNRWNPDQLEFDL